MPEDDYQVQRVITAYSLLTGRGDWDPVLALFTEDGVWEIPHLGLRFAGHDAIRAALAQLSADLEWVLQHNAPALIEVNGDTATARSGIREVGKLKGRDESVEYCGIYADTLVRTSDGWKFARRVFEAVGTIKAALVPGG
ncbi:nuclear transport factor 2 family protein [Novosphingobium sp. JCM 18896]|uniref:nuclear transport factor 2 family protein n=1 Tax=Novosphingobium sp. JCM 18896 TaxID=2989731 RepID=UPI0022217531|nr:nuclear transport factor 2 family protein [Novosphingobium sp. JCM 18896]MCW1430023.1 nuclear transport factor 2 family protein [Novosphingobium sp. JCM 18896]